MEFSYEGIGQVVATFAMEEALEPGMVVSVVDSCTVGKGSDGDIPSGVVLAVDGDCCAVQVGGFAKVPYADECPAVGMDNLAVDGKGRVQRYGGSGLKCMIVQVDEENKTAVIKL